MTTVNEYFSVPVAHPEWAPVTDPKWVEGYEVSQHGEVRSPKGKILKPNKQGSHLWLSLRTRTGSGISSARLDRLVLSTFLEPPPPGFTFPSHLDGNTLNCDLSNLTWASEPAVKEPEPAAPPVRRQRKAKAKTVAPKGGSEVEVLRVYKRGSLQLSVNVNGQGELSKKSRLTTDDMATLADLLQRAVEMNRIMGQK